MSALLSSIGFTLAGPNDDACLIVSVRRTTTGIASIESWLLGAGTSIEEDLLARETAKTIADGISASGETLVTFARTDDKTLAIIQVAQGLIDK
jgi:hypothetical protein